HGVSRYTLSRHCQRTQGTKRQNDENQQLLSPVQELVPIEYINRLLELGLPSTVARVCHFAFDMSKDAREVGV
ncbi:hypothetical protein M433DRAFT_76087, partial [Acidomyces richmondensis BFW]